MSGVERLIRTWEENGIKYNALESCVETCQNGGKSSCHCRPVMEVRRSLAAYEETGLTPEEIEKLQRENAQLKIRIENLRLDYLDAASERDTLKAAMQNWHEGEVE